MAVKLEISQELEDVAEFFTPEKVYENHLDGMYRQESIEGELAEISRHLDDKIQAGAVSGDDLGMYEEASRRAGFFAGFTAARTAMQALNTLPGEDFTERKMVNIFRSLTSRERIKAIAYMKGLADIR